MGFLSAWDQEDRIDVSDLAGAPLGTWWVDVKRTLSHAENELVMKRLMKQTVKIAQTGSKPEITTEGVSVDGILSHQTDLVVASIVAWNLTDSNDQPLPVMPKEALLDSLNKLPATVFDRIAQVVMDANTEKPEEVATFHLGSISGNQDGQDDSSDDREVLV